MIVSDTHRYVYIAIPKAGSRSVAQWLIDHYAGEVLGFHHAWQVPATFRDYCVFTVVRNPYERCFSAWWFRCMDPVRRDGNPMFGWPFHRFMRSVLAYRSARPHLPGADSEVSSMTQSEFCELSGAQLALPLERPADLHRLPFTGAAVPALPRFNETPTKPKVPFDRYFTEDDEQLVWQYCAEDFASFGYSRWLGGTLSTPALGPAEHGR